MKKRSGKRIALSRTADYCRWIPGIAAVALRFALPAGQGDCV